MWHIYHMTGGSLPAHAIAWPDMWIRLAFGEKGSAVNWQALFFSADGRIGQKDFWIAVLIMLVIWVLAPALHILAPVVWLVVAYCWVCVFAKRLHDFGKSGWLILLPAAVWAAAFILAMVFGGLTAWGAIMTAMSSGREAMPWTVFMGALGSMLAFFALAGLAKFVFVLWVGLSRGDAGENRYGPPPSSLLSTPAASPPA
jgi:uncharacterized membrane protein YhaH (DUF805 family)